MTIVAGTKLGRYEIRSKIGEGGMGEVYLAQDTELERTVALKVLPADVAANAPTTVKSRVSGDWRATGSRRWVTHHSRGSQYPSARRLK